MADFVLTSPSFRDGQTIPANHVRDGENVSPPLEWRDPPDGTQSFALIMYDPDAPKGTFHHWAVFDITPDRTMLPEGTTAGAKTEPLGHGVNDFGNGHYDGPQPPPGHGPHRYHFLLLALNTPKLHVSETPPVTEVWETARPFVIGEARLTGIFER